MAKQKTVTPLGERILAACQFAGISPTELQRRLFPDRHQGAGRISRYISGSRGQRSLDPHRFEEMADLLGVDFHWLLTGRGKMTPPLTPPAPVSLPKKRPVRPR